MGRRAAIGRGIVVLAAIALATARGYAREFYEDETSAPVIINFSGQSGAGPVKQFVGEPADFTPRPTFLNRGQRIILGRVISSRVTLGQNPDGAVLLTLEHVSISGDTPHSGDHGYFTGTAQASRFGTNMGGIAWTVEIYDATNSAPIYTWNGSADGRPNEEIKCGTDNNHSFSTTIRPGGALSASDILSRAARVRAIAAPAEWTHC
jgi:hypothetical protein